MVTVILPRVQLIESQHDEYLKLLPIELEQKIEGQSYVDTPTNRICP